MSAPPRALVLLAAWFLVRTAAAAGIDAGEALYTANCIGCHGTPPNGMKIDNLAAANRPELIRLKIQTVPEMSVLRGLGDSELADIATYLANPTSSDADCVFGWGEQLLPTLLTPRTFSARANGFDYRYYPPANVYVGVTTSPVDRRRHLYVLDAKTGTAVVDIGLLDGYLAAAIAAGCP